MSAEFMYDDTDTGFDDDTLGMGEDDTLGDDDMIDTGDFEEDGLPAASDLAVGTDSDTSAADIVKVADQPAIPPYFGGAEGHALRESAFDAWVAENSAYYQLLSSIMTTEMFQTAASYCQTYIDEYNEAAATVLYLEHLDPPSVSYEEFWGHGASVLDGAYDLASQFTYYANFTETGDRVTCIADCYVSRGGGLGCGTLIPKYYPYVGTVPADTYCALQWDLIDQGFNKLKVCAAKAIGGGPTTTRPDLVRAFQLETMEQQFCHFDYCQPANPTEACPTEAGGAEKLFKEYEDVARVEGRICGYAAPNGLSPGAIAGIVIGCVLTACLAMSLYYLRRLNVQRKRYKKRLVQNVARNVSIAPSAGGISADKLAAEFAHIDQNGDGSISKSEMRLWLEDGKLGEVTDKDFDAMWDAMSNKDDKVTAIDFFVFLSGCGDAFDEVYKEQSTMNKSQKIAFASRRLSVIAARDIKEKVEA